MRRLFGMPLVAALFGLSLPAAAEPASTTAGERTLVRRETSLNRKCSRDAQADCAAMAQAPARANDTNTKPTATDACTNFNAAMAAFCGMVGDHEPDSPEMLKATANVIAAKKELLKQRGLLSAAKHS